MIENGNFASSQSNNSMNRDQEMIERARQMATPSNPQPEDDNNMEPKRGISRRALLIGAGVLGLGGIGAAFVFVPKLLQQGAAPNEETSSNASSETSESSATENAATSAKGDKFDAHGETLVVGQDMSYGYWYVEQFAPSARTWLSVEHQGETYDLEKPKDQAAQDWWANQILIVPLNEGDKVIANATFTRFNGNNTPAASLAPISELRSGMYLVGADLAEGEYTMTMHEAADDIDLNNGTAMEGDLSWPGRVAGSIGLISAVQNFDAPTMQSTYAGVIVLSKEEAIQTFGPLMGANLPFSCEALTGYTKPGQPVSGLTGPAIPNPNDPTAQTSEATSEQAQTEQQTQTDQASYEQQPAETASSQDEQATSAADTSKTDEKANADTSVQKTAYHAMSAAHQHDIEALISLTKPGSKAFYSANKKTIQLSAEQYVIPIMVDMTLNKSYGSTESDFGQTPELDESSGVKDIEPSIFD